MDFELSSEQKDVQRAATEFARGEFDPDLVLELDESGTFPDSLWKKAAQLGFIGIHYPEAFGGQGMGLFENLLVIEAFCRADSGVGAALSTVDLGSEILLKFGSIEQKKQFLIPLTKGEVRLGVAFAESEDGRDLTVLSAMAEKRADEYALRGRTRTARSRAQRSRLRPCPPQRRAGCGKGMVEARHCSLCRVTPAALSRSQR